MTPLALCCLGDHGLICPIRQLRGLTHIVSYPTLARHRTLYFYVFDRVRQLFSKNEEKQETRRGGVGVANSREVPIINNTNLRPVLYRARDAACCRRGVGSGSAADEYGMYVTNHR